MADRWRELVECDYGAKGLAEFVELCHLIGCDLERDAWRDSSAGCLGPLGYHWERNHLLDISDQACGSVYRGEDGALVGQVTRTGEEVSAETLRECRRKLEALFQPPTAEPSWIDTSDLKVDASAPQR